MRLNNEIEIKTFMSLIDQCEGGVYLTSQEGDVLNLKSIMTRYVAVGKMLADFGCDLELFCDRREDEAKFLKFFKDNPDVL